MKGFRSLKGVVMLTVALVPAYNAIAAYELHQYHNCYTYRDPHYPDVSNRYFCPLGTVIKIPKKSSQELSNGSQGCSYHHPTLRKHSLYCNPEWGSPQGKRVVCWNTSAVTPQEITKWISSPGDASLPHKKDWTYDETKHQWTCGQALAATPPSCS